MYDVASDLEYRHPRPQPCDDETQTLSHTHLVEGATPSFSHRRLRSPSPAKELSYQSHATIAERRNNPVPPYLVLSNHQPVGNSFMPVLMSPIPNTHKGGGTAADYEWDSESVYSRDDNTAPYVSPLKVPPKGNNYTNPDMSANPVLHEHYARKHSSSQIGNATEPPVSESFQADSSGVNSGAGEYGSRVNMPQYGSLYSPLTPFFADKREPAHKKGSKIMFGQNGWLEKTGQTPEKKNPQTKGMFEGIKKMAKGFVSRLSCSAAKAAHTSVLYDAGLF